MRTVMKLQIETKSWSSEQNGDDSNEKTISGKFVVKCGAKDVAIQSFNSSFGNIKIPIPPALLAKVDEIDKEIRKAIVENFNPTEE